MATVLHFRRQLDAPPVALELPGISVRNMSVPADVVPWLTLRERAMAGEAPPVRQWSERDFHAEMLSKSWWRPDWTWLAIAGDLRQQIGAVTLAMREGTTRSVPVVHWLLVDPTWQHRGVGRLLMSHLERAAWEAGWREIELETHAGWAAAVAFYQSIGYARVRERSPR